MKEGRSEMKEIIDQYFDGERPLFGEHDAKLIRTTFGKGESPLKNAHDLELNKVIFQWKYPLWYDQYVKVDDSIWETMSRSGIWYTKDIEINNSAIQAPKQFRRCDDIRLNNVHFGDAEETMWSCRNIKMNNVQVNGDYFGINSENIYADHLNIIGNYAFDGAKNVEIHNSTMVTKDNFWNCENVVVYDSFLNGEYLAWNTNHITLINCTIESDQGLCYTKNLTMKNCRLLHTDLAFEYCENIDAEINSDIESVKNPISGKIKAHHIDEIIMDPHEIDPSKTTIITDDDSDQHVKQH